MKDDYVKNIFTMHDGTVYQQDEHGVHQLNAVPFVYDKGYCAIYDNEERRQKSAALQAARLGFIMGAYGSTPSSILDYGCGNYAFLETAKACIKECYGYDIADYPTPVGLKKTEDIYRYYDVVSFHDALEHVKEPNFVAGLRARLVVVSLPNRGNIPTQMSINLSDEKYRQWFGWEYFHRKPGEHLHHYTWFELSAFMAYCGWYEVCVSNHEDLIRRRGDWNIISMAFKRKD